VEGGEVKYFGKLILDLIEINTLKRSKIVVFLHDAAEYLLLRVSDLFA